MLSGLQVGYLDLIVEVNRSIFLRVVCLDVRYFVLGILQSVYIRSSEQEINRFQALTSGFL